jgi:hypothetical protein
MKSTLSFLVLLLLLLPATPVAAAYQPETRDQLIAYLLGRIEQLQTIVDMLENGGIITTSRSGEEMKLATIDTRKADDVEATSAVLRGEANVFGGGYVWVWFEYGEDSDFLDFRSDGLDIESAYDRAVRIPVYDLESDEKYYYRMVGIDHNNDYIYGPIYSFRTDEDE